MVFDVVSFGETMLRMNVPAGTRLEEADALHMYVAGTESNTLACLARLNLKATWISALPENPVGQRVITELRRHGVDTTHVILAGSSKRVGIFYAEEAPDPLGLQVHYDRAGSAVALLDPESVNYSVVDEARLLHLTGITPALSPRTREVFARFLLRAHDKGIPLSFDVNYRSKLWSAHEAALHIEEACRQANLLFCTRDDAAALWGCTGNAESMLRQMAQWFAINQANKTLVLTLGSEGSAQLRNDMYSTEPAFPTQGNARFGSGDAFAAGYIYAYLDGQLYHELHEAQGVTALSFGNALAALKRCIAGDIAIITPQEVRALLGKQESKKRFR
ncbi:MAG: bifunctional 2-dehydro-3-deoxygluconokinase/2-dehydro-3-deoxygalactonokinase [Ktedonobacteraceae bacterium]